MKPMLLFAFMLAAPGIAFSGAPPPADTPGIARAPEPVVHRGDQVLLCARAGAVVAAVPAEALQDAGVGQRLRVRNLQNGKVVPARVTAAGQVEVTQ